MNLAQIHKLESKSKEPVAPSTLLGPPLVLSFTFNLKENLRELPIGRSTHHPGVWAFLVWPVLRTTDYQMSACKEGQALS